MGDEPFMCYFMGYQLFTYPYRLHTIAIRVGHAVSCSKARHMTGADVPLAGS